MHTDLSTLEEEFFGIIIPDSNGIRISNQCGGTCCSHPEVVGFYIPLPLHWKPHHDSLIDLWEDKYPLGEINKFLDQMEQQARSGWAGVFPFEPIRDVVIVSEIMEENVWCGEAWVPVKIVENFDTLDGAVGRIGFITYNNSD